AAGHPPELPVAPAADPDDHPGRGAGCRAAAGRRHGRRGNAPAAGPGGDWRAAAQPVVDPVHHAGGLSQPGAPALARPLPVSPGTSVMNALPPLFLLSSLLLAGCAIGPDYQ